MKGGAKRKLIAGGEGAVKGELVSRWNSNHYIFLFIVLPLQGYIYIGTELREGQSSEHIDSLAINDIERAWNLEAGI